MFEFNIPLEGNKKLETLISQVKKNSELETLLKMSNITAIDRLGYNDHGPTHIKIVANSSLRILRILIKHNITPSVVKDYKLQNEDAEVIVVLAAILHDIGHAIHRKKHELLSTVFAAPIIDKLIENIYTGKERTIVKFETLHTIYCHEANTIPLTIEGGVMKIADALDMEKGRARIPYQIGSVNIHSMSAIAIEKVRILDGTGTERPIKIVIYMSDSAGIFQIDELLKEKIKTSGIAKLIEVEAILVENGTEKVLKEFKL